MPIKHPWGKVTVFLLLRGKDDNLPTTRLKKLSNASWGYIDI
jgi:hypothetical protein